MPSWLQLWDPLQQRNYFDKVTHRCKYDASKGDTEEGGGIECQNMIRFEKSDLVILRAECNSNLDGGLNEIIGRNLVRT